MRATPRTRNSLGAQLRAGELIRPFPGVYVRPDLADDMAVRVTATQVWRPSAVILGTAVEVLHGARRLSPIDVAVTTSLAPRAWLRYHRFDVPDVSLVQGIRVPPPAWNALWLASSDGGDAINEFLRRGGDLADLHAELARMPGRSGQDTRRRVLHASTTRPWSMAERRLHALLREAGIEGWTGNAPIDLPCGVRFGDVVFRRERVCLEVDGYEHHAGWTAFNTDRERHDELVAAGWRVLHFTWLHIAQQPDWLLDVVRRTLGRARRAAVTH